MNLDFKIKNTCFIERTDLEGNVLGKYKAENIITDKYFTNRVFRGSFLSMSRLYIGNGQGTPSFSDTNLFNYLTMIVVDYSAHINNEEGTGYGVFTAELSETVIPDTYITELGLGGIYSDQLYTHAMITDLEGRPCTIHKGPLERMKFTYYFYVSWAVNPNITVNVGTIAALSGQQFYEETFGALKGIFPGNLFKNLGFSQLVLLENTVTDNSMKIKYRLPASYKYNNIPIDRLLGFNKNDPVSKPYEHLWFDILLKDYLTDENNFKVVESFTGDGVTSHFPLEYCNFVSVSKVSLNGEVVSPAQYSAVPSSAFVYKDTWATEALSYPSDSYASSSSSIVYMFETDASGVFKRETFNSASANPSYLYTTDPNNFIYFKNRDFLGSLKVLNKIGIDLCDLEGNSVSGFGDEDLDAYYTTDGEIWTKIEIYSYSKRWLSLPNGTIGVKIRNTQAAYDAKHGIAMVAVSMVEHEEIYPGVTFTSPISEGTSIEVEYTIDCVRKSENTVLDYEVTMNITR